MAADLAGEITAKREAVFDGAVHVIEERHLFDSDDARAPALLLLPDDRGLRRRHVPEAGLSPGGQHVGDMTSLRRPSGDGAGGAVLQVVGVGDDGQRPLPFVIEDVQTALLHGHTLDVSGGAAPRDA